jgi:hypothetical protein
MRTRVRVCAGGFVLVLLMAAFDLVGSVTARAQSQSAAHRVIIVLRDQVSNLPTTRPTYPSGAPRWRACRRR